MLFDLSTIDLKLLKRQKQALFEAIHCTEVRHQELLDGILNLLDCIQDELEGF
jgi:hypothetical protein